MSSYQRISRPHPYSVLILVLAVAAGTLGLTRAGVAQELDKQASWQPTDLSRVAGMINEWAAAAEVKDRWTAAELRSLVNQQPHGALPLALEFLADWYPWLRPSVDQLKFPPGDPAEVVDAPHPLPWEDPRLPESARTQLKLATGVWFARYGYYDESLECLDSLSVDEALDRAGLLFHVGLSRHRLLKRERSIRALNRLLENESAIPRRYAVLAHLMIADLESVEEDSLDEIARMMDDIHRRQSLYRSGTRVIRQEEQVIDKLDKLIEEIEQQMQQQQQASSSQQPSGNPMEDSKNAGGRGQGKVTDRRIPEGGAWGNLPPRQRAAALAEMAKDLPPHYREVIEEYFRQLAKESDRQ